MTATNHVVTGVVIGAAVGNPWMALPAAFASHFVLDVLPHYGEPDHTSRRFLYSLVVDMALASGLLLSIILIQPTQWPLLLACGVVAASPDLLWLPYWLSEMKGKPRPLSRLAHRLAWIQWGERGWGIGVELVWLAGMMYTYLALTAPVAG